MSVIPTLFTPPGLLALMDELDGSVVDDLSRYEPPKPSLFLKVDMDHVPVLLVAQVFCRDHVASRRILRTSDPAGKAISIQSKPDKE